MTFLFLQKEEIPLPAKGEDNILAEETDPVRAEADLVLAEAQGEVPGG